MQVFIDQVTGACWKFEDDVLVSNASGSYVFKSPYGAVLNVPTTLQPGIVPPPPTPPIPSVVTMRQARLALLNAGLLTQVNNTIAALPGTSGDAARIEWEFASAIDRNSPIVASLSASLGLTSAQLDSLFTAAAIL